MKQKGGRKRQILLYPKSQTLCVPQNFSLALFAVFITAHKETNGFAGDCKYTTNWSFV